MWQFQSLPLVKHFDDVAMHSTQMFILNLLVYYFPQTHNV